MRRHLGRLGGVTIAVMLLASVLPMQVQASTSKVTQPAVQPPAWGCAFNCVYLKNVRVTSYPKYFAPGIMTEGNGPQKIILSRSGSVSNGFSATVGISSDIVTAKVGVSVTQTQTVTFQNEATVPAGQCWRLQGVNVYQNWAYDVWTQNFIGDDTKIGTGTAWVWFGNAVWLYYTCV